LKFEFPDTGEGVTEGEFLEWLVEEGEEVEEDQAIAEAETDKAVIDVPAPSDGVVTSLKAEPGETVEVGDVIMEMDAGEEENTEEDEEPEDGSTNMEEKEHKGEISSDSVLALPKVRKLAEEGGVDLDSIDKEGRITEDDVRQATKEGLESGQEEKDVMATPSVRKLAREEDIDLEKVDGSGRGGKITREDVLGSKKGHEQRKENESVHTDAEAERIKMSGLRKTVASKMEESRFTAPHVTHVEKVDMTELSQTRENLNEEEDQHLTFLPFIIKAVSEALENYPDLNAELDEESNEIVRYNSFDFNIAVDTERGLLTPLIRSLGHKNMIEIAAEIESKAEKAREGEIGSDELENGTFSITNLGAIGGKEFTPIINYPQAAILGIGEISETAEVIGGEIEPRETVKLSLSYDHRIVDGADAARFMNEVKQNLEDPESMLVRL